MEQNVIVEQEAKASWFFDILTLWTYCYTYVFKKEAIGQMFSTLRKF